MRRLLILLLAFGFFAGACQQGPDEPNSEEVKMEKDEDMIGLSLSEAEKMALSRDLIYRVTMLDGKHQPATRDYRQNRVNFVVEEGKVVGISRG
ncbi:MAG: hypothetical protein AAGF67_18000 [Verrucomicrobiota bacterium]